MKILNSNLPAHIGIIMDGNGRWAIRRGLPRKLGHKAGVDAIERTIGACLNLGIKYCTFFAFSTENWKRDKDEIDAIFDLIRDYLKRKAGYFFDNQIKVNSIGVLDPFPDDLKQELSFQKEKTRSFDRLTVTFALNYGGRDDIIRAVNSLITDGKQSVTEQDILNNLDTKDLPMPDLIIRTSGEQRVSNFMLFQMAYSEFYFPKIHWPDFDEKQLKKAIKNYQKRERRFGGLK